jgi:hypothetical protein
MRRVSGTVRNLRLPKFVEHSHGGNMKHGFPKAILTGMAAAGLLAGCATTVDWGGPLLHYRYHYDSRPIVYSPATSDTYDERPTTYSPPVVIERPVVSYRDDD